MIFFRILGHFRVEGRGFNSWTFFYLSLSFWVAKKLFVIFGSPKQHDFFCLQFLCFVTFYQSKKASNNLSNSRILKIPRDWGNMVLNRPCSFFNAIAIVIDNIYIMRVGQQLCIINVSLIENSYLFATLTSE